jgi:hypothetical protein
MEDCGTIRGVVTGALKEGEDIKEPLAERILGRVTVHDVHEPMSGEPRIAPKNNIPLIIAAFSLLISRRCSRYKLPIIAPKTAIAIFIKLVYKAARIYCGFK